MLCGETPPIRRVGVTLGNGGSRLRLEHREERSGHAPTDDVSSSISPTKILTEARKMNVKCIWNIYKDNRTAGVLLGTSRRLTWSIPDATMHERWEQDLKPAVLRELRGLKKNRVLEVVLRSSILPGAPPVMRLKNLV